MFLLHTRTERRIRIEPQPLLSRLVTRAALNSSLHIPPDWAHDKLGEVPVRQPCQEEAAGQHVHPEVWDIDEGDDQDSVCGDEDED